MISWFSLRGIQINNFTRPIVNLFRILIELSNPYKQMDEVRQYEKNKNGKKTSIHSNEPAVSIQ